MQEAIGFTSKTSWGLAQWPCREQHAWPWVRVAQAYYGYPARVLRSAGTEIAVVLGGTSDTVLCVSRVHKIPASRVQKLRLQPTFVQCVREPCYALFAERNQRLYRLGCGEGKTVVSSWAVVWGTYSEIKVIFMTWYSRMSELTTARVTCRSRSLVWMQWLGVLTSQLTASVKLVCEEIYGSSR
eukprot:6436478-Amphidinium_carterae.1